jgi:hypothetical protein
MSSFVVFAALLAVLAATAALDEDFGFDVSDDFEVEIDGDSRKLWNNKEITTGVGKVFHLVIPQEAFGKDVESYEVRTRLDWRKRSEDNYARIGKFSKPSGRSMSLFLFYELLPRLLIS